MARSLQGAVRWVSESWVAKARFGYGWEAGGAEHLFSNKLWYWVPLHKPEGSCSRIPLCAPAYLCKHFHILLDSFQDCREPGTTMATLPEKQSYLF